LTEVENVDFAKTLSMQNSRFIRDIISEQGILGEGYTKLLRRLYDLEYKSNERDSSDQSEEAKNNPADIINFDLNNISIVFPSPSSLNMTNLTEMINNVSALLDSLTQNLKVKGIPDDQHDAFIGVLKQGMLEKYITNFDWDDFNALVDTEKVAFLKASLKETITKTNDPANAQPDMGGDESMDDGSGEEEEV
jgi:hypothetical protein